MWSKKKKEIKIILIYVTCLYKLFIRANLLYKYMPKIYLLVRIRLTKKKKISLYFII